MGQRLRPMIPRLRFAPSPTGYLHVGGARTALFNWLSPAATAARSCCASRTPTSSARPTEMVTGILDGLRWLGLTGTKGPRSAVRTRRISSRSGSIATAPRPTRLVAAGTRYYCYCRPDELQASATRPRRRAAAGSTTARACGACARRDRASRSRRRAARGPLPRAGRADLVRRSACTADRRSTTPTSRTSSSSAPTATRPTTSRSSSTTSTWGSRTCPRRRSHLEHAEAGAAVPGARRAGAAVRARAADPRARTRSA